MSPYIYRALNPFHLLVRDTSGRELLRGFVGVVFHAAYGRGVSVLKELVAGSEPAPDLIGG